MKRILIVDDDTDVLEVTKNIFERSGYAVQSTSDGIKALDLIRQTAPFDLIILDVQMPQMNGFTFMNELKKFENCKTIPVIMLTAYAALEPLFTPQSVKGYLVKPVQREELLEMVKRILSESN